MELLLDSVILIDHFNNIPAAADFLANVHGKAAISVITRAETMTGFEPVYRKTAGEFLDLFPTLPITKKHC